MLSLQDGSLKVIERCKHIFKLAQGEYVSPEKVEQVYQQSTFVSQVFVDGDGMYAFPIALVVPEFEKLQAAIPTEKHNVSTRTNEELCQNPEAKKFIMAQFKVLGDESKLLGFEKVMFLTFSAVFVRIDKANNDHFLCRFEILN